MKDRADTAPYVRAPIRWHLSGLVLRYFPEWRGKDRLASFFRGRVTPNGRYKGTFGPAIRFDVELGKDGHLDSLFFLRYRPPALAPILDKGLKPGACFYDVGANVGMYSLWASSLVGPAGCVYSFEPVGATRALLESLLNQNDAKNVQIVASAVGREAGESTIYAEEGVSGLSSLIPSLRRNGGTARTVSLISLDRFASRHRSPELVKIDVEGYEHEVLLGMTRLLKEIHPLVVIEIDPKLLAEAGTSAASILELLDQAGYETWNLRPSGLEPTDDPMTTSLNVLATHRTKHSGFVRAVRRSCFPRNQTC